MPRFEPGEGAQVLATLAATLLMGLQEIWSRRAYVLNPRVQHLVTPADRAAWAPARYGGGMSLFGNFANGWLVSVCIAWHLLLVVFADKNFSVLRGVGN